MPAEWDPHEATWLGWPHEESDWPGKFAAIPWAYAEIVRHLARVDGVLGEMADVGDVDNLGDLPALELEVAAERVGEREGAVVADVLVAVDGRAAIVHADVTRLGRRERFELVGEGVVELHAGLSSATAWHSIASRAPT